MGISDILSRAPALFVMWILMILLLGLFGVLYLIQNSHISKSSSSLESSIRSLGNAMGGIGIAICVVGVVWVIVLIGFLISSMNVAADPSSLYVSRHNLLLNWFTGFGSQGISGNTPGDGTQCFGPGFQLDNDPTAYDQYRAYIKDYEGGGSVNQTYELWDGTTTLTVADDLVSQQKLSLAYYRFLYCTQTYFTDILNKNWSQVESFLLPSTLENLKAGKSNCGNGNIPDTQACTDGKTPGQGCAGNLCFAALNETIAAQCLLYDDHVYNRINSSANPTGVLDAFDIATKSGKNMFSSSTLPGYQVKAPK